MRFEYREDKYGQWFRAINKDGIKSNWQQTKKIAKFTLMDKLEDMRKHPELYQEVKDDNTR